MATAAIAPASPPVVCGSGGAAAVALATTAELDAHVRRVCNEFGLARPPKPLLRMLSTSCWGDRLHGGLRVLDLNGVYLGAKGACVAFSLIAKLPLLERLEMNDCGLYLSDAQQKMSGGGAHTVFGNDCIDVLARSAGGHPSLRFVELRGNGIGTVGAKRLLDLVQRNPRIIGVDVAENHVRSREQEALTRQLATNLTRLRDAPALPGTPVVVPPADVDGDGDVPHTTPDPPPPPPAANSALAGGDAAAPAGDAKEARTTSAPARADAAPDAAAVRFAPHPPPEGARRGGGGTGGDAATAAVTPTPPPQPLPPGGRPRGPRPGFSRGQRAAGGAKPPTTTSSASPSAAEGSNRNAAVADEVEAEWQVLPVSPVLEGTGPDRDRIRITETSLASFPERLWAEVAMGGLATAVTAQLVGGTPAATPPQAQLVAPRPPPHPRGQQQQQQQHPPVRPLSESALADASGVPAAATGTPYPTPSAATGAGSDAPRPSVTPYPTPVTAQLSDGRAPAAAAPAAHPPVIPPANPVQVVRTWRGPPLSGLLALLRGAPGTHAHLRSVEAAVGYVRHEEVVASAAPTTPSPAPPPHTQAAAAVPVDSSSTRSSSFCVVGVTIDQPTPVTDALEPGGGGGSGPSVVRWADQTRAGEKNAQHLHACGAVDDVSTAAATAASGPPPLLQPEESTSVGSVRRVSSALQALAVSVTPSRSSLAESDSFKFFYSPSTTQYMRGEECPDTPAHLQELHERKAALLRSAAADGSTTTQSPDPLEAPPPAARRHSSLASKRSALITPHLNRLLMGYETVDNGARTLSAQALAAACAVAAHPRESFSEYITPGSSPTVTNTNAQQQQQQQHLHQVAGPREAGARTDGADTPLSAFGAVLPRPASPQDGSAIRLDFVDVEGLDHVVDAGRRPPATAARPPSTLATDLAAFLTTCRWESRRRDFVSAADVRGGLWVVAAGSFTVGVAQPTRATLGERTMIYHKMRQYGLLPHAHLLCADPAAGRRADQWTSASNATRFLNDFLNGPECFTGFDPEVVLPNGVVARAYRLHDVDMERAAAFLAGRLRRVLPTLGRVNWLQGAPWSALVELAHMCTPRTYPAGARIPHGTVLFIVTGGVADTHIGVCGPLDTPRLHLCVESTHPNGAPSAAAPSDALCTTEVTAVAVPASALREFVQGWQLNTMAVQEVAAAQVVLKEGVTV